MRLCLLLFALTLVFDAEGVSAQYRPQNATPPVPPVQTPARPAASLQPSNGAAAAPAIPADTSSQPAAAVPRSTWMPESMDKIDDKRQLIIGDVVNFRVIEDHDQAKSLLVNDSGEIEVPLIGRVPAAGKTLRKLADEIKVLLEKDYYYQATVLLAMDRMSLVRGKVYVVGQVHAPGGIEIPTDENFTVSKAILKAGGFGDFADQRRVKLVRKKNPTDKEPQTIIVDCKDFFKEGNTSNDPVLQSEDLIIVPQRLINF